LRPATRHALPVRLGVLRAVAVCAAISWLLFPGFGVADLLVTWNSAWAVVLEAGWGLFSTVLVAAAFVAVAVRPRRCAPALVQLGVAAAALLVAALAGGEPPALFLVAVLAGETVVVTALALTLPGREPVRPFRVFLSVPLLALTLAGAGPWIGYAVAVWRTSRTAEPLDVTVGVDHATVQGALAVALAALPLLASLWPSGRRQLGVCSGLAGGYLGLVSLGWPGTPAGFGTWWSALALAWGVAVAVVAAGGRYVRVVAPERSG
jgi:hypothetical protein